MMHGRFCETCGMNLRSTPESKLTQCCCCMTIDAQQELHDTELAQIRAENSRLKSAHSQMEHELNTLRSRELCIDDIADYTETIQRLKSRAISCCFCGEQCKSLDELKEHSARCPKHPAVKSLDELQTDFADSIGELLIEIPQPGTEMSKLLCANTVLKKQFATLRQKLTEKDAEIERLTRERLTLARQYDPNCDEYDFGEQIQSMMSARQHVEAVQDAASKYGRDPESCLVDFPGELLGELTALREQNAELVRLIQKMRDYQFNNHCPCDSCHKICLEIDAAIAKHGEDGR